jgi:hypothetical protein
MTADFDLGLVIGIVIGATVILGPQIWIYINKLKGKISELEQSVVPEEPAKQ